MQNKHCCIIDDKKNPSLMKNNADFPNSVGVCTTLQNDGKKNTAEYIQCWDSLSLYLI